MEPRCVPGSNARGRTQHISARKRGTAAEVTPETDEGERDSAPPDLLRFAHTDTGNAERLVRMHGDDIRFCSDIKKWLKWDGRRWSFSDARHIKQLIKRTMRETRCQATDAVDNEKRAAAEKHALRSESAILISAALSCAEYETGIPVSAIDLDRQPFLLNCENGTLDLRDGVLRPHDRADLITKLVHVPYRADAQCPRFLRFLQRIMGDGGKAGGTDRAERLVAYLQKCFGYALTGDVSEKAVFCFFGTGNNGKTTLLEIVRYVIAEYSAQVLIDSIMSQESRESSAAKADLADLRGARFVTTSESEEGQKLAVGKLKYLTQGMGQIKTCRKYENPIVFPATHKLFIDANHRPVIRGAEKAAWNRLKPIPFLVTIPPAEIDRGLLEKLQAEEEGILAWMVEGCRRRLDEGLGDPPEIVLSVAEWRAESDRFLAFIHETYTRDPKGWVVATHPWTAYGEWCGRNREQYQLSKPDFDRKMAELGFVQARRQSGTVRAWIGLRLRESAADLAGDKVTFGDTEL